MKKYIILAVLGLAFGATVAWAIRYEQRPQGSEKIVKAFYGLVVRDKVEAGGVRADEVEALEEFVPPIYTTANRPDCNNANDANRAPKVIFNSTTKSLEVCNDEDGSFNWDPISYDGDRDGFGRSADEDDANAAIPGSGSNIAIGNVANPTTVNRSFSANIPRGLYGTGAISGYPQRQVTYTVRGDANLVPEKIQSGQRVFDVTGTLRHEVIYNYTNPKIDRVSNRWVDATGTGDGGFLSGHTTSTNPSNAILRLQRMIAIGFCVHVKEHDFLVSFSTSAQSGPQPIVSINTTPEFLMLKGSYAGSDMSSNLRRSTGISGNTHRFISGLTCAETRG